MLESNSFRESSLLLRGEDQLGQGISSYAIFVQESRHIVSFPRRKARVLSRWHETTRGIVFTDRPVFLLFKIIRRKTSEIEAEKLGRHFSNWHDPISSRLSYAILFPCWLSRSIAWLEISKSIHAFLPALLDCPSRLKP